MADLKPCPFCGENLVLMEQESPDSEIGEYYAHEVSGDFYAARKHCAMGAFALYHKASEYDMAPRGEVRVEQWNRRPIEDAQAATIELMRGLLGEALPLLRDYGGGYVVFGNRQNAVKAVASRIDAELKGDGDG